MDDSHTNSFNKPAWEEQLIRLNGWARGLEISEDDAAFVSARKKASSERFLEGQAEWNIWAQGMLAACKMLADAGIWSTVRVWNNELALARCLGQNDETVRWLSLAVTDFTDHVFKEVVDAKGFIFPGEVYFTRATFNGASDFQTAQFYNVVSFKETRFNNDALFRGAQFLADAEFRGAHFVGRSSFAGGTKFLADAWFKAVVYQRPTSFRRAQFSSFADFEDAVFQSHVGFSDGTRFERVKFDKAKFYGKVWFNEAFFAGNASFSSAHFYRGKIPISDTGEVLTEDLSPEFSGATALKAFSLDGAKFDLLPNFTQFNFSEVKWTPSIGPPEPIS